MENYSADSVDQIHSI